ncbi:MAG: hypothetical protein NVSMB1_04500 [Polyangiales bacterium]
MPVPTLANAGASVCKIGEPVVLGAPIVGGARIGFGGSRGVAVFYQRETMLAFQPIGLNGATVGAVRELVVSERLEPSFIFAIDRGFIVLLKRSGGASSDLSWWGVFIDHAGTVIKPPVDLGQANLEVVVAQPLSSGEIGLILAPPSYAKAKHPAHWVTLTVDREGNIVSRPAAVMFDDLLQTSSVWEPAAMNGKRGWVVSIDGARRPDGLFGGTRGPAAQAVLLRPNDVLEVQVWNGATPPPPSPGFHGRINEPFAQPVLTRTLAEKPVGEKVWLEWESGTPSHSMYADPDVAFSGTHFLYPFYDNKNVGRLLPIDCRPESLTPAPVH